MLLEVGKAAGERRTARVDDARVRHYQVHEPEVEEVARHLVDEVRPAEQAVRARLREVALAEGRELGVRQARHRLRVNRRATAARPRTELESKAEHVRQLARALPLGM